MRSHWMLTTHRYRPEIRELLYHPCNDVFNHGAPIGSIQVFVGPHTETNANKMCPWSLRTMRHFTHVYVHVQAAEYKHLTNHIYFDHEKNQSTPSWSPCQNKDGAGSEISGIHLCDNQRVYKFTLLQLCILLTQSSIYIFFFDINLPCYLQNMVLRLCLTVAPASKK